MGPRLGLLRAHHQRELLRLLEVVDLGGVNVPPQRDGDLGHLGTVTSAIWKVVQRPWLTTLAPWADIAAGAAEGPQWVQAV